MSQQIGFFFSCYFFLLAFFSVNSADPKAFPENLLFSEDILKGRDKTAKKKDLIKDSKPLV